MSLLAAYLTELQTIRLMGAGVAETSYYPPIANLFNAVGKTLKPRVICLFHLQNTGAGIPEAGFFTASQLQKTTGTLLQGQKPSRGALEVKSFEANLDKIQASKQVHDYLQHYNQVLITNLRDFRLLIWENNAPRLVDSYTLAPTTAALFLPTTLKLHATLFPDFLARVLRRQSAITDPSDLAWFLASFAREARTRAETHPLSSFETIQRALEQSLGLQFEGEKGEHFFRSTLVQTLFYGIFSAWVLWSRTEGHQSLNGQPPRFDWRTAASYLRVPVLRKLFNEVSDPGPLDAFQITEMLDRAGDTLARVDRPAFFSRFSQADAVQYFYEPFLEAFDPQLRKDLGVWYTPREIVHYMVERVDHLLRTELNQPLGLASPHVTVLDPCCGTGAYLTAVLDRVHRTLLQQAGDDAALVPDSLRTAALTRIFGFEILPAPFVIAHLQLAAQLAAIGAPLIGKQRAGVFLTNALTGWVPEQEPKKSIFPDLQKEKEDAEAIKRGENILVILGNPPYNGYSGIAKMEEERDLTTAYRAPVHGLPKPQGQGLNDLYVRFFRIAERRIMKNATGQGIVCFISNNAWLDGLSHTTMRHHYLQAFSNLFIDNLNGDSRRTGKTTPEGKPDPSAFTTSQNREGIQVGTAIATFVRSSSHFSGVAYRDLWGVGKLSQLQQESTSAEFASYVSFSPNQALGSLLAPRTAAVNYTDWPRVTEILPVSFPGIQTARDYLLVGIDRTKLDDRLRRYLDSSISHDQLGDSYQPILKDTGRFRALETREALQIRGFRPWQIITFAYRPFDNRWLYWEPTTKLLDEKREEYVRQHNQSLSLVFAQDNRKGFDSPVVTTTFANRHLIERGGNVFPLSGIGETLPGNLEVRENLSNSAMRYVKNVNAVPSDIFFHILAITHTASYREENDGALRGNWPRIPLPSEARYLNESATLGRRLSGLLDTEIQAQFTNEWSFLARLSLPLETAVMDALAVTASWGYRDKRGAIMPSFGLTQARPWAPAEREKLATLAATESLTLEQALTLLGDSCVDVHLNGDALWSAVPANVWAYTLGGYQVLKKWLSYRELPLLGRPLKPEEARYFSEVVRRITAILLLGPALDASYQAILPTAQGLPTP